MSIIGEAFIAVSPESAGFASKLNAQLTGLLASTGLSSGALAGITAVATAFAAAAFSGQEFIKSTAQIQRETGATGVQLAGLADIVRKTFASVPESLTAATTAVDELTRRGVPLGATLQQLAIQESNLAKITGGDLATQVATTTALFNKFNIPLGQQSAQLDVLFKAQQQSGKSFDDLTSNLQTGAVALQAFGLNLTQSAALIASLDRAGFNLQPTLAALRLAFGKIAKEGEDPKVVLAGLTKELTDGQNPARGMADAITLFGSRSGAELARAIETGRFSTADLIKLITDGKGGIDATAASSRTLGEQFTLMKNKIFAALEPVGVEIAKGLSEATKAAGTDVSDLVVGITDLATALGPDLLPILAVVTLDLEGLSGILGAVGIGLSTIAKLVSNVNPELFALGAAVTIVGALITSWETVTLAALYAIDAAASPIFLVVAAIAALGAAVELAGRQSREAAATAKSVQQSFTDSTGHLVAGIDSARDAFAAYTVAQEKAVDKNLPGVLGATGASMSLLATKVFGTKSAFEEFRAEAVANAKQSGNTGSQLATIAGVLDKARAAAINGAQADAQLAVASQGVTEKQLQQIEATSKLSDGTVDWSTVLTRVSALLDEHQQKIAAVKAATDQTRLSTFESTAAYAALVAQLTSGKISEDQFNQSLADTAGVAATAAKAVGDQMVQAMQSFVSTALSALPTVASAIDKFQSDVTSAQDAVKSALTTQATDVGNAQQTLAEAYQSSADAIKSAEQSLDDAISTRNKAVADATNSYAAAQAANSKSVADAESRLAEVRAEQAQKIADAQGKVAKTAQDDAAKVLEANRKLAADRSPQAFIDNLNAQTKLTATFMANLQKLVAEGFTPLAAELAKKGPEAAGALTANLASDPVKADAANKAASIGEAVTSSFQAFLLKNFNPIKNDGTLLGKSLIDGIIAGIEGESPALAKTVNGLAQNVVEALAGQWRIKSPSLVAQDLGAKFGEGLALGIEGSGPRIAQAAATLGQRTVDELRRLQATKIPSLLTSGQDITGQAGDQRADAAAQTRAAPFAGAHIVFEQGADPLHVATEIAWRLRS